jgi:hypothetical protein
LERALNVHYRNPHGVGMGEHLLEKTECPWRYIKHLKNGHDTFADVFMDFEKKMPNDV